MPLIAMFTFWGVAVAIVLVAVTLSTLSFLQRISPELHVPREVYIAVLSLPVVVGGFALLVSWRESIRRQQHVRDLAEATEQVGLQFVPLVTAPASLVEDAFPVVCPTPPSGWSAAAEKPQASIFGTGIIHGQASIWRGSSFNSIPPTTCCSEAQSKPFKPSRCPDVAGNLPKYARCT